MLKITVRKPNESFARNVVRLVYAVAGHARGNFEEVGWLQKSWAFPHIWLL